MKIAKSSNGITTYEELMVVCGHIKDNDFDSYLFGMLGLTEKDMVDFANRLNDIHLSKHEELLFTDIVREMRESIVNNHKAFNLDMFKYTLDESPESQKKIGLAFQIYMEYVNKVKNFASIASDTNPTNNSNDVEGYSPKARAIARGFDKLSPENQKLYTKLLNSMLEDNEEEEDK